MLQIVALRRGIVFPGQKVLVHTLPECFTQLDKVLEAIPESERYNLFYTLAHHSGAENTTIPVRTAKTFLAQEAIGFDIDHIDCTKPDEYAEVMAGVTGIAKEHTIQIATGNGYHFIVLLRERITQVDYFRANKPHYNAICERVDGKLRDAGLPGNCDKAIFEPARILRLPGTENRKPNQETRHCTLINYTDVRHAFRLHECSGLGDIEKENILPSEVRKKYPNPDLNYICSSAGCKFMHTAITDPSQVHEPDAFDILSLLVQANDAHKIHIGDRVCSPQQVARHIVTGAVHSASLARANFDNKWEQATRYGARKCDTVANRNNTHCTTCPHFGNIRTPLDLKSEEHISTEEQGFWVLNAKGNPLHPHYGDLQRVFRRDLHYIALAESKRVFVFSGTHYTESYELQIKNWIENKVRPSDPLREFQRNEFYRKVLSTETLDAQQEDQLFEHCTSGKINVQNGVLDVKTGTLLEHSPRYGFRYVLPFAYEPEVYSELFMDWLELVTFKDPELIETLLDFMAYCLWPTYDDHCFMYMVGDGRNGKSTLVNIMNAIVGDNNVSAVSMDQLVANRFAPAQLDGKLINISSEANGKEITTNHLSILKALCAGEKMQVEKKCKEGFMLKNKAKLFFLANTPPRFGDIGDALKARMVTVPFNYKIENPDPRVESRLIQEAPKILSMLVNRIRQNIKDNGHFKVSRGGATLQKAQEHVLLNGNPIFEWAKENVFSAPGIPDDQYITIEDAWAHFNNWLIENGYKNSYNKIFFGKFLRKSIIAKTDKADVLKINKKAQRILRKCRWKVLDDFDIED